MTNRPMPQDTPALPGREGGAAPHPSATHPTPTHHTPSGRSADRGGPLPAEPTHAGAPPALDTSVFSSVIDLTSSSAAAAVDPVRVVAERYGPMAVALHLVSMYPFLREHLATRLLADQRAREAGRGTTLNVPSGGAQGPTATNGDPASGVIQTPGHGGRNTTSRNTDEGLRFSHNPLAEECSERGSAWMVGQRCFLCREHPRGEVAREAQPPTPDLPEHAELARAWSRGYCFGYYQDRAYSDGRDDVPPHLVDDLPVWNPYDPTEPDDGEVSCTTEGCPGDARYAPPGRGHIAGCDYLSPRPVTSMDCYVMGRHNPHADHTEDACDRGKHYIPMPMAFVHLTVKDCE